MENDPAISPHLEPTRIPSGSHPITADKLSANAIKVLDTLCEHGYHAYLVGGCIRDIYLGIKPKDFDIATNALPDQIAKCFKNCRLIGKRFRLAHIRFGRELIEVATFRGQANDDHEDHHVDDETGMVLRDNVYGKIEDDVFRRDFTINALYYDHQNDQVIDYVDGIQDIKTRNIRVIGEPNKRYQEDPVRILRAIRHACKLDLNLSADTEAAIPGLTHKLEQIAPARLFEEYIKLFLKGAADKTYEKLQRYNIFGYLFPGCQRYLGSDEAPSALRLLKLALQNTDIRFEQDKPINPAFLIAVFLWHAFQFERQVEQAYNDNPRQAAYAAFMNVTRKQAQHLSVPKRFVQTIRDMWELQSRLHKRYPKNVYRCLEHEKFRAGYDLLVLRSRATPEDKSLAELADWWTVLQEADSEDKKIMIDKLKKQRQKKHPRTGDSRITNDSPDT